MRKTHWISLIVSTLVALCFVFLESRRVAYFVDMQPQIADTSSTFENRLSRADILLARLMQYAEWGTLDARFKMMGHRPPNPDVVIVGITDRCLKDLAEWPWSRRIHAALIRSFEKHPPAALLFDIFFIDRFTADPKGDVELVNETKQNPWVVHSFFTDTSTGKPVRTNPFPALAAATKRLAFVNAEIDDDGVLRRAIPRQHNAGQKTAHLLSVVGASLYSGLTPEDLLRRIPLDKKGRIVVNFAGPENTFKTVAYSDILRDPSLAESLAGKVVLVGSLATGAFDHYPTPLSKFMPGVEFHANIIDNLLQYRTLQNSPSSWTYVLIIFFGIFCGAFLSRISAWAGALWALGAGVMFTLVAQNMFVRGQMALDMASPLLTLTVGYVFIIVYRFFSEESEKRWVKAAFGQYVSSKVLDVLMEDPSKLRLGGERREMTMLFSDVAGFTSISERLNPEALVAVLNRYLTAMTEEIFLYEGYLNKYMGDGIMAFWNAPMKQADHAARACRCALASVKRLKKLNDELTKEGMVPLSMRIGVNSGMVAVGNMGSLQKSDYTVMGDHVNLASRLEGANKAFGTPIMISEFTYELVQASFEVRFLDIIRVPGRAKPVKTYELLGEKGQLDPVWEKALPIYHEAIQLFADRAFEKATGRFTEVSLLLGQDKPCQTYIQRAQTFMATPPAAEWDGVFEVKTK